jgi:glycosyltransferase involved in cell wall biosynthesis
MKVALIMTVVSDLDGSGGTERLFGRLHEYLAARPDLGDVWLVTSATARQQLEGAGQRLDRNVCLVPSPGKRSGAIDKAATALRLLKVVLQGRFDLVHVCLPSTAYVPFLSVLSIVPTRLRPRVCITVVDCTLAHNLQDEQPGDVYERQVLEGFQRYERWTRLDGIFSWYEAFSKVANTRRALRRTLIRSARFCFADTARFTPSAKQRLVVFAGRLSGQKRPGLFVDAVASLLARYSELAKDWRFEMYGTGVLEARIRERIDELGLSQAITLHRALDMAPVFAKSKLFVSTQALENFTSLAMLEAMAAGNAVIAEDVGQTSEFVRDDNGILVSPATDEAFADAMAVYLKNPERHDAMARASRRLATEVHTIDHFAADLTTFWRDVLAATE